MATLLTDADLIKAAQDLGCAVAAIRAVDQVESTGRGFDQNGNIIIRFETAVFKKYGGYTIVGSGAAAYNQAAAKNARAALLSTSWGRYQIMGFNYAVVGYATVEAMVADFTKGEPQQLAGFVKFCQRITYKGLPLAVYLQRLDWVSFKNGYNGTGANNYAEKLVAAYNLALSKLGAAADAVKKKSTCPTPCSGFCACCSSAGASTSTTLPNGAPSGAPLKPASPDPHRRTGRTAVPAGSPNVKKP